MPRMDSKEKLLFKKRAHRPWKSDLLESTIAEADVIEEDLFPKPAPFFDDPDALLRPTPEVESLGSINQVDLEFETREEPPAEPTDAKSRITLGGFFQANHLVKGKGEPAPAALSTQETLSYPAWPKKTEALESPEASRRHTEQARLILRQTEQEFIYLQNQCEKEREARLALEQELAHSRQQLEIIGTLKAELQKAKEAEARTAQALAKASLAESDRQKAEAKAKLAFEKMQNLTLTKQNMEVEIEELKQKLSVLQDAATQLKKVEGILETERQLRRSQEAEYKDSIVKAQEAEQARKLAEEKANHAIQQANRALMHFLTGPQQQAQQEETA